MTKATKKIERRIRKTKKRQAEKDLQEKVGLFSKLGDCCLVCEKEFDKKDKKMVLSWYVVVKDEKSKVNLYCPDCWNSAVERVKQIEQQVKAEENND